MADPPSTSATQGYAFPEWAPADGIPDVSPSKARRRAGSRSNTRYDTRDADIPEESNGYLAPAAPTHTPASSRPRRRLDSLESWGSSVMPAALPFGAGRQQQQQQQQQQRGSSSARRHDRSAEHGADQPAPTGIDTWLRSQSLLVPSTSARQPSPSAPFRPLPPHAHAAAAAPPSPQFPSAAPAGRLRRRVESDAGSVAGQGSVSGWSTGVLSAGGRPRAGAGGKGSGRERDRDRQQRSRPPMPLWEGDTLHLPAPEEMQMRQPPLPYDAQDGDPSTAGSGLDSVQEWRDSSALPEHTAGVPPLPATHAHAHADSQLRPRPRARSHAPPSGGRSSAHSHSRQPSQSHSSGGHTTHTLTAPLPPTLPTPAAERPDSTPLRTFVRAMMRENLPASSIVLLGLALGLLAKWAVAAGGWSASARPGWLATRDWMALTAHLPAAEWYSADTGPAGRYRPLSKPPLAGWLHALMGSLATSLPRLAPDFAFPPPGADLSPPAHTLITLLRLALSHALHVPAVLFFLSRRHADRGRRTRAIAALSVLLQPALTLADYGLGESNALHLGLATLGIGLLSESLPNPEAGAGAAGGGAAGGGGAGAAAVAAQRVTHLSRRVSYAYVAALAAFLLAFAADQATLYFAPAVGAVLLGRLVGLGQAGGAGRSATLLMGVLGTVAGVGGGLFWPWLGADGLTGIWASLATAGAEGQEGQAVLYASGPLPSPSSSSSPSPEARLRLPPLPSGPWTYAPTALILLVTAYPALILFRAARETVRIEMRLSETYAPVGAGKDLGAPAEKGKDKGAPRATPAHTPSKLSSRTSASVNASASKKPRPPRAPPSEAESDLRSFAESLVRGGVGVPPPVSATAEMPDKDKDAARSCSLEREREKGREKERERDPPPVSSSCPSPVSALLPYAAASIALGLWIFSPLLSPSSHGRLLLPGWTWTSPSSPTAALTPLLPLTLLLTSRGDPWAAGAARADTQWGVLAHNLAAFGMYPRVREEGLPLQYVVSVLGWNWLVGAGGRVFEPLWAVVRRARGRPTDKAFSASTSTCMHTLMLLVHLVSLAFALLGLLLPSGATASGSGGAFAEPPHLVPLLVRAVQLPGLLTLWLWSLKRVVEVGIGNGLSVGVGVGLGFGFGLGLARGSGGGGGGRGGAGSKGAKGR